MYVIQRILSTRIVGIAQATKEFFVGLNIHCKHSQIGLQCTYKGSLEMLKVFLNDMKISQTMC